MNCINHTNVTFSENSNLVKIENGAFYGIKLTEINVPSKLNTIETMAFKNTQLQL